MVDERQVSPPREGPIQLLVVDEQRMFADALTTFLHRQTDIDVVGTAHSAAEAVSLVTRRHPHVVTTGYRLPDGDGIELIVRLRQQLDDVKVIVVSAFEQVEVVVAAIDAGCSGFIPKSAPMSDVAIAAQAVMSGQIVIPSGLLGHALSALRDGPRWRGTNLTAMELEILRLFAEGLSDRAMGDKLGLSERSVRNHVQSILTKLESHSKLEGLAAAIRRGIIFLTFS